MDDKHKENSKQENTENKVDDITEFIQSKKEENELLKKIIEKINSDKNLKKNLK